MTVNSKLAEFILHYSTKLRTKFILVFAILQIEAILRRQFQKSSKMSENSCCDLKTGRFGLVRRSLGEGGWLFPTPCHGIAVRRRRNKTTIFISSTIFFQSNFAGLLKLPLLFFNVKTVISAGQPIRTGKPFQIPVPLET